MAKSPNATSNRLTYVQKSQHGIWPPKPPKICTKGIPMESSHKTGPYEAIKVIWNYTLGRGGVIEGQNSPKNAEFGQNRPFLEVQGPPPHPKKTNKIYNI